MADGHAPTFFARSREAWHDWLESHHATEREIWLVLLKAHVGRPSVTYEEAVEEALCFGWIDGMLRRIDDESHRIRFTPRKPGSIWAQSNKARVARLIAEGRMTPAGMALVEAAKRSGEWERSDEREDVAAVPPDLAAALAEDAAALTADTAASTHRAAATGTPAPDSAAAAWERLAPSHKKQYLYWIGEAKRPATRARRVAETVRRVREGRRPGE